VLLLFIRLGNPVSTLALLNIDGATDDSETEYHDTYETQVNSPQYVPLYFQVFSLFLFEVFFFTCLFFIVTGTITYNYRRLQQFF
jgi:hypothetical protein